ncbi:probable lysine-specific demethylase 4A isoform X2 [Frankliniella occidentalis]|uniref:Probable lysine-specific demethylase 4A isoform X2 n=1 Tax=Frankliniella occidentalis TaxID=133901 RepID=A0A6J1SHG2_FRAOC|nr:probable lysine-specific demethylase 4A isoform X2 [Frankliniella occidentalis]
MQYPPGFRDVDHALKGRAYCEKRRKFIDLLVSTDFCNPKEETKLEIAMNSGGVDEVLDELYRQLADKDNEIWYGPGVSLPTGTSFQISKDLNLSRINSPHLDNLVNMKNVEQTRFEGINSPTIYIGTQSSTFGLHIEDFAFESINRSLGAAEKLWFVVPPAYYGSFCLWMSKCGVPPEVSNCPSFLQHRQNFIDPRTAVKAGFPVRTVRQRVGDVVYLLPFAIHWGVNLGFTLNEAVKSCSKSWLHSGLLSKPMCQCHCRAICNTCNLTRRVGFYWGNTGDVTKVETWPAPGSYGHT